MRHFERGLKDFSFPRPALAHIFIEYVFVIIAATLALFRFYLRVLRGIPTFL